MGGMTMKVGIGVIGCGRIAQISHLTAYHEIPEAEIVAVADIREEIARKVAHKFGAKASYADYNELLRREDVDAVSICTPPELHSQMVISAAEQGKHILCEKPLALNAEDAKKVVQAAKKASVIFMTAFMKRFDPGLAKVKELLEKGQIGTPTFAKIYTKGIDPSLFYEYAGDLTWGGYIGAATADAKSYAGVGALSDTASHYSDQIRWYFGDFSRIDSCSVWPTIRTEANALALFHMKNNVRGLFELLEWGRRANTVGEPEEETRIYGTEGMIRAFGPFVYQKNTPSKVILYKKEDPFGKLLWVPHRDKYVEEIRHFVQCVREGKNPCVTGEDGKAAVEFVEACYRSAEMKIGVDLPLKIMSSV